MPPAPRRSAGRPRPSLPCRLTVSWLILCAAFGVGPPPSSAQGPTPPLPPPASGAKPDPSLNTDKKKADHVNKKAKDEIDAAQKKLDDCEKHKDDWEKYLADLIESLGCAVGFAWKKAVEKYAKGDPNEKQLTEDAKVNELAAAGLAATALGGGGLSGAIEDCAKKLGKRFNRADWAKKLYDSADIWRHGVATEITWTEEIKPIKRLPGVAGGCPVCEDEQKKKGAVPK
jgi:hypothetical protein